MSYLPLKISGAARNRQHVLAGLGVVISIFYLAGFYGGFCKLDGTSEINNGRVRLHSCGLHSTPLLEVLILRTFMASIPLEIVEAAINDDVSS